MIDMVATQLLEKRSRTNKNNSSLILGWVMRMWGNTQESGTWTAPQNEKDGET